MFFRVLLFADFCILISIMFIALNCNENHQIVPDIKSIKDTRRPDRCVNGMMCKEDSDCYDGLCKQGVCYCQSDFCQKDEDCGEGKCCNPLNGICYDCVKDTGVLDVEDIITDEIPADLQDDSIMDTSQTCKKDLDCPLNIPHCSPDRQICVECYDNSHCRSGICDIANGICVSPVEDAGEEIMDVYDASTDMGYDAVSDISDISDPCKDYICLCSTICKVIDGNPTCVSGCNIDSDCCANTICKNGECIKTSCTEDRDCKDASKPHCDPISGICYECTNDLHCQQNYYCDSNHLCKYKVDECYGQCDKNTQWCNPVKKQCEDIPTNWCAVCSQVLDPLCLISGLTCGLTTKRCTKQCNDDSECFGYTCNMFNWCTCP